MSYSGQFQVGENSVVHILLFTVACCVVFSCQKPKTVSLEAETEKILKLHNAQRENHFKKDSIAFTNQLSEHFISVNRGEITTPEKDQTISRYHNYFSSVEFIKWDDVSEPIIKFSDDASMAYTIVDKIVRISYKDENGETVESETHFAWTAIYKKYGNEWKTECVTSTNKPDSSINETASCKKNILEKDSILGAIRNHAPVKMSLSKAITNYANDLKSLDYSNCPEAFEVAFQKHIEAWLTIRSVTDKHPSLRGELHDIFEDLEQSKDSSQFKLYLKDIWDTWSLVEESTN